MLPFYHLVTDNPPTHIKNLYKHKTIAEFKEDLDYLLTHFKPITLQELISFQKSKKNIPHNCFHLTFDDGLSEFYHIIAPILIEKKIPATIFLNNHFIDNKDLFYRYKASILSDKLYTDTVLNFSFKNKNDIDELAKTFNISWDDYLTKNQPYLTTEQINELIHQGFTIGAHSLNHPLYEELSLDEQIHQTIASIEDIKNRFQLNYAVFSFPFTDFNVGKKFFSSIKNHVDLTFGSAGIKDDEITFNLQRLPMENKVDGAVNIKMAYSYYLLKKLIFKNTIKR